MLYVIMPSYHTSSSKFCVMIKRSCTVRCTSCKWTGKRQVGFMEAVSASNTADVYQSILETYLSGPGQKGLIQHCPKCDSPIKFVRVPNSSRKME